MVQIYDVMEQVQATVQNVILYAEDAVSLLYLLPRLHLCFVADRFAIFLAPSHSIVVFLWV